MKGGYFQNFIAELPRRVTWIIHMDRELHGLNLRVNRLFQHQRRIKLHERAARFSLSIVIFLIIYRIHGDRSFHCEICGVCLDVQLKNNHKCRADSAHDECCICLEVILLLAVFELWANGTQWSKAF